MPAALARLVLPAADGDRGRRGLAVLVALTVVLVVAALASLAVGPVTVPLTEVAAIVLGLAAGSEPDTVNTLVVGTVRIPRAVMAVMVGAALGTSGAVMQALFRNPLADPGVVGVSSGAALGAMSVIVLGVPPVLAGLGLQTFDLVPPAAFLGALAATVTLYLIATRNGRTSTATMLLAGIALAALAAAGTGVLVFLSTDQQLRDLTFWSLGSLAGATWPRIAGAALWLIPALAAMAVMPRGLNGLLLGEVQAMHIGIDVQRLKAFAVIAVSLAVGSAVAVAGVIGFVGIVAPHMLRLVVGPDHRYLLPASAALGAVLLILADMVARVAVTPAELPIGILTALLGGPAFLWLLLRQRGIVDV